MDDLAEAPKAELADSPATPDRHRVQRHRKERDMSNEQAPQQLPASCPISADPLSAIGVLITKVDANTELTQCLGRKLDVHAESHKEIDRHMADVRRVLFERDGLADQARDCKNFREGQSNQGRAWPAWVAAIGGALASLVMIWQVLVMIFHK